MTTDWAQLSRDFEAALARERVDFAARQRMLYRRPDYQHLERLAHDLRVSHPFDLLFLECKREWQWAVNGWLFGRLTASEFRAKARRFETAIGRAFEVTDQREIDGDRRSTIDGWKKWIRRWSREGFVSRVGWQQWFERTKREKEFIEWRQRERQRRAETAEQRAYLKQGQETLRAMRRVLRGQDPLPQPESTPARSSQT